MQRKRICSDRAQCGVAFDDGSAQPKVQHHGMLTFSPVIWLSADSTPHCCCHSVRSMAGIWAKEDLISIFFISGGNSNHITQSYSFFYVVVRCSMLLGTQHNLMWSEFDGYTILRKSHHESFVSGFAKLCDNAFCFFRQRHLFFRTAARFQKKFCSLFENDEVYTRTRSR